MLLGPKSPPSLPAAGLRDQLTPSYQEMSSSPHVYQKIFLENVDYGRRCSRFQECSRRANVCPRHSNRMLSKVLFCGAEAPGEFRRLPAGRIATNMSSIVGGAASEAFNTLVSNAPR
eukprot:3938521-Rhodomonas_salina.4